MNTFRKLKLSAVDRASARTALAEGSDRFVVFATSIPKQAGCARMEDEHSQSSMKAAFRAVSASEGMGQSACSAVVDRKTGRVYARCTSPSARVRSVQLTHDGYGKSICVSRKKR